MRTAAKARIAGVVTLAALVCGAYTLMTALSFHFPAAAEAERINSQLKNQEASISGLDSRIVSYWTAITDVRAVNEIAIPASPQAYCQNLPVATSQLESSINNLLCSSLETRAQINEALPALQAQAQAANKKAFRENNLSWGLQRAFPLAGSMMTFLLAGISWWGYREQERKERYMQQSPTSPV